MSKKKPNKPIENYYVSIISLKNSIKKLYRNQKKKLVWLIMPIRKYKIKENKFKSSKKSSGKKKSFINLKFKN